MFFKPTKIIEEGFFLNFIVSERGAGKTFSTLLACVDIFRRTGKQFVYLRRTEADKDKAIITLLSQLQVEGFHTDVVFKTHGHYITCDGVIICYLIAISTAYKYKSVSFSEVEFIVFDEFISENNSYLKFEVKKFLSVIETIARMRDVTIFCLGNQNTVYNPYYIYFDVKPSESAITRFRKKSILVNNFKSVEYRSAKLKTKFGQLIEGTDYGDFMLNNKAVDDDYTFIDKLEGVKKIPMANMILSGVSIVVYECMQCAAPYLFFISRKPVPDLICVNFDDILRENTSLAKFRSHGLIKRIKISYGVGNVRFNDLATKNVLASHVLL